MVDLWRMRKANCLDIKISVISGYRNVRQFIFFRFSGGVFDDGFSIPKFVETGLLTTKHERRTPKIELAGIISRF